MWLMLGKTLLAALMISFVSYFSGKKTHLAGFLTALPITTLLALAFSHAEWGDGKQSVAFAKSIFTALPLSLSFFLPFLFAEKLSLNFWQCYAMGIIMLGLSYFIHQFVVDGF